MTICLSLGAGVQSSTMALMSAAGCFDVVPDFGIFADTGDEPKAVYKHLDWLMGVLPFPVHITSRGKLSDRLLAGDDAARIPAFVGTGGISGRQCTRNYKIRPIRQKVREMIGKPGRAHVPAGTVSIWIGISKDEAWRMKPSGLKFMVNRWPLIEMKMSRADCERWLLAHGFPIPPKSACEYCPMQEDARHRDRQRNDPEGHQRNIALDMALRSPANIARFRGELYLHRSRKPLSEVDFTAPINNQPDLFVGECEGHCGL